MNLHRLVTRGLPGMLLCCGLGLGAVVTAETVKIDGSSTVAPITNVAAEMYMDEHDNVDVTVGVSGTGGGFEKFHEHDAKLRTDINDASRPIKPSEIEKARKTGVEFIELPVAMDGLAVVVNPSNSFCNHLTVAELKRIWEPGSKVKNWKDIRPGFPDLALKLYGPGPDSGTFDFFTEVINGKEDASRSDYTASESDNLLVQGVAGDKGALGYFGFSYYENNRKKLKLLGIDGGDGKPTTPSLDSVRNGTYRPLSRPLFMYVNKASLQRPDVRGFLDYFFDHAQEIVEHPKVLYVALPDELYSLARARVEKGLTGSVFADLKPGEHKELIDLYRRAGGK